jgi:exosome complex component RRP41
MQGLRQDGRRAGELRFVDVKLGIDASADGSCELEQGLTRVVARIYGPSQAKKRGDVSSGKCAVNVEYVTASFSTVDRKKRQRGDRQSVERGLWIGKVFEQAILVEQFARSQIDVVVEVLQDHGGTVAASINAVSLALVDAGIPLKDRVVAVTVGVQDDRVLVDLSQAEADKAASQAQLLMAVYATSGSLVLCECEAKISFPSFQAAFTAAQAACAGLAATLRTHVVEYAARKLAALQSGTSRKIRS